MLHIRISGGASGTARALQGVQKMRKKESGSCLSDLLNDGKHIFLILFFSFITTEID